MILILSIKYDLINEIAFGIGRLDNASAITSLKRVLLQTILSHGHGNLVLKNIPYNIHKQTLDFLA